MRGPAGVPVGVIRRVILSNITCMQRRASPRIGSIVAGIPGHPIEDVKISDVMIVHAGGGTQERCAAAGAGEGEGISGAENVWHDSGAWIFHPARARAGDACDQDRARQRRMRGLRLCWRMWRARSSEGSRQRGSRASPTFSLRNVKEFSVYRSKPVPDTEIAEVEKKEI